MHAQSLGCAWLLQPHELWPTRLLCPRDYPGKDTGVGYHFFLQGIFQTQGSNTHLLHILHWQGDSLPLNHLENPDSLTPNPFSYKPPGALEKCRFPLAVGLGPGKLFGHKHFRSFFKFGDLQLWGYGYMFIFASDVFLSVMVNIPSRPTLRISLGMVGTMIPT